MIERLWRGRFVCAFTLSLLVHVGLLVAISAPHEGRRAMQDGLARAQNSVLNVELVSSAWTTSKAQGLPSAERLQRAVPAIDEEVTASPLPHETEQRASEAEATAEKRDAQATKAINPSDETYLEVEDLDQSATLVGEWYVLADQWPPNLSRIELRLWISSTGAIKGWAVLQPKDNPKVEASLEHLERTILNPALRNGQAVASVMDVELLWGE